MANILNTLPGELKKALLFVDMEDPLVGTIRDIQEGNYNYYIVIKRQASGKYLCRFLDDGLVIYLRPKEVKKNPIVSGEQTFLK